MSPEVPLHKLINKLEENWESSSDDGWEDDDIDLTEDDNEDDVVTYRLVEYLFMRIQSLGIVVDEGIKGTIDFRQKSLAEPSESNFLEHESKETVSTKMFLFSYDYCNNMIIFEKAQP